LFSFNQALLETSTSISSRASPVGSRISPLSPLTNMLMDAIILISDRNTISEKRVRAMGIKQRRERERQAIRQSILSAARAIAAEEGWQAVTTRKVAERIEYSQPTIYEYFENKEAILLALLHHGYERLLQAMQHAARGTQEPEERLLAICEAY